MNAGRLARAAQPGAAARFARATRQPSAAAAVKRALGVAAALALSLPACSGAPEAPEAQIRAFVAEALREAEARDLGALADRIADDYADARGRDKRAIRQLLVAQFFRNREIHLLAVVRSVEVTEPDAGHVSLLVAMAGEAIDDPASLERMRADLHRFELALRGDGDGAWQVVAGEHRRAVLTDFVPR